MMLDKLFPDLYKSPYDIASPRTDRYNCIAWAAGDEHNWSWPGPLEETYWPPGVERHETIEAFVSAFATLGYEICENAETEEGFEKVALYIKGTAPKHAAKQLVDGRWASKLGELEDIVHDTLESLHGGRYGEARVYLRRSAE